MFAIKAMREKNGLTQQYVADHLNISYQRYSNWERETREINLRDACLLADLFHCTLDELAGRPWPPASATSDLTDAEKALLDVYRSTDSRGRETIDSVAQTQKTEIQTEPAFDPRWQAG